MAVTRGPTPPAPSEAQRRRSRAMARWHRRWAAGQMETAAEHFTPRHAGSDYNQHVADVEADGEAEDEFARRAGQILARSR